MSFAGRYVLRRNERSCCPLSQKNKHNCNLKGFKLTQSSRSSCRELTSAWMVNSSLFTLFIFICRPSHCATTVISSRALLGTGLRMHQGQSPAWEKTPRRFLVMGGWRRHSSSETSYPDKLMESRQPPGFGAMQRTNSLGQMKQKGAPKEL